MTKASDPAPRSRDRLRALDRVLARDPDCDAARFERAGLLREEGAFEAAKRDYLELIRRQPDHFGALNDFAALVLNAGYREAARSLYAEAVRRHPGNANGRVNLANLLLLLGEIEQARAHFEAALAIDPGHIHAHRGMGNLLAELGDMSAARQHRDLGFKNDFVTTLPYRGEAAPVSVLLLVAAAGGNIPTSAILDDRQFRTTALVAEYCDPTAPLPPHDVVFNSIGDADLCGEALAAATAIVQRSHCPVVNHPAAVMRTGRAANAGRLRGLPNVAVPRMIAVPRRTLAGSAAAADAVAGKDLSFPVLARAPGFHTGRHFVRAQTPDELAAAAATFPGEEVWLIEQLDARDGDGLFRKFRVMIVDGKFYPLHLAVSANWKVHYFTADMTQSAANRDKDKAFLDDMAGVVGKRGMAALHRIAAALGLDYGGIDFAVNAAGDILFFEANATMVVLPPTADAKWNYRRPAYQRVVAAVRAMLTARSLAGGAR